MIFFLKSTVVLTVFLIALLMASLTFFEAMVMIFYANKMQKKKAKSTMTNVLMH